MENTGSSIQYAGCLFIFYFLQCWIKQHLTFKYKCQSDSVLGDPHYLKIELMSLPEKPNGETSKKKCTHMPKSPCYLKKPGMISFVQCVCFAA